ncbi:Hcp family type VI secretion system effector [Massilia cellulosiltytica]|uniref:Hcp family type VI secretion system effector n=1 Tax=Massilia cellulosiltytica TaxID=2683234 RepID=UPI0039B531CD
MAADVYLQIDGVNGESNDDRHKGWIEIVAVDWGVTQPTAGTVSTAGGHTVGRAVFDAIRITKAVDLASPKLMELAAQGKTIPKAKLEFFRADGSGALKYYEVMLESVLVSSSKKSWGGSGLVLDQFTLHYARIAEKYTQQKIGGGAGGNTSGGWDLAANKTAA